VPDHRAALGCQNAPRTRDLYLMARECEVSWTLVGQGAQGARDSDLLDVVARSAGETSVQLRWLSTRMKQAAPQALVVAS
jgi:hypothetical protein